MQFKKHDRRQSRIEKQIQESLASFLLKNLSLSSVGIVSVTRVHVPRDLKTAEIYVHQFPVQGGGENDIISILERRAGLMQKHLSHELKLRFCPRLDFHYDTAFDKTLKVDKLIHDLSTSDEVKNNSYSKDDIVDDTLDIRKD